MDHYILPLRHGVIRWSPEIGNNKIVPKLVLSSNNPDLSGGKSCGSLIDGRKVHLTTRMYGGGGGSSTVSKQTIMKCWQNMGTSRVQQIRCNYNIKRCKMGVLNEIGVKGWGA